jgi:chromosome segregation ATPase
MTDRPQLNVVDGGKGEREQESAQPKAATHLEARLAAELRAQRELNADLTLDLGAARAAVSLAARRQEDLLTQLQLEREARRQMKLQVCECEAEVRVLADRLRISEEAVQATQQDNVQLAARAVTAEATSETLAQQLRMAGEAIVQFKAQLGKRNEQVDALHAGLSEQTAKQTELGERIALVLAESEKAAAKARAAVAANAELTAQVRAFVSELATTLNVKDAQALDQAPASFGPAFAAINAQAAALYDACVVAQADIAALRAEKGAISAQLVDLSARHAEMATKADNRFVRLTQAAKEIAELREELSARYALVGKLEATLKERDDAIQTMVQDGKRLRDELEAERNTASHLDRKVAKQDELLLVAAAEARQREAELRAELARAKASADEMASKIEAAGIENARLAQAEQVLGAELAELNRLLDERRTTIRQLQQELALIKLGRKKALPGS